jgi:GTP-binding protein
VDLSDENWKTAFEVLKGELESFAKILVSKSRILVATKLDLPEAKERFAEFETMFRDEKVFGISVFSGEGLEVLKDALYNQVINFEKADKEANELEAADSFFDTSGFDEPVEDSLT